MTPTNGRKLVVDQKIPHDKKISEATFEALRTHFDERDIVELTWLNAFQNYTNLVNIPLEFESNGFCAIDKSETEMEQDERTPVQNVHV